MESPENLDSSTAMSRRRLVRYTMDKMAVPVFVSAITASFVLYINNRVESRHDISISIVRSDSAAPPEPEILFPALFPEPTPTAIPEEDRVYTYTTLIRNSGDFSEQKVIISILFQSDTADDSPLAGPEIDTSSSLLSQTLTSTDLIDQAPGFALAVPRLDPGEWISLKTTWKQSKRVVANVRSSDVAESARI